MEHRALDITVQHAKDLNKVNLLMKMEVYAVVSVFNGATNTKQRVRTPPDRDGDDNPTWDFPIKFAVDEAALQMNALTLVFRLICRRALGDRYVGEVHAPIKELLGAQGKSSADGRVFVSYQVRKADGKPKGQISFCYRFSDKFAAWVSHAPATAYPVGSSSGYPPPTAGNPPPAVYGYGYPPPPPMAYPYAGQGGYRYGHAPPPMRNNNLGLGLGTGLIAGALGGLLLGDMMDDCGDCDSGDGGVTF
ncbi:hypothetical protein M569_14094 [Genlisea aurea]|uniref:C2 domain-containing protein n=1 Tax=Genlisea aurea TaxID=192259 RepID=S8C1Y0_9LAMI|nr:hypothetical protein M569_14094 [Genlisea aurea]